MKDEDFWNSIEATEEEKKKGTYYLRERGLEEHFHVLDYLESFKKNGEEKISYSEIASVLRYDKRIRRCLFKYIGVVEERLRAYFMDHFRDDFESLVQTRTFNMVYEDQGKDLYKAISHLDFGRLVGLFKKQQDLFKKAVFGDVECLRDNLDALVRLRNQVCHNKFLLNNLEFKLCHYQGTKSSSLWANIRNLWLLSDSNCKESLVKEMHTCAQSGSSKYKNQVEWRLPEHVKLSL